MATANNKSIKIPTQHYVGFQKRMADEVPLGFMTPDGTDQAAMKRKATVDSWAKGYGYGSSKQATLAPKSLENKPMSGFKFGRLVGGGGRGWDARSDAWRIEDPRGFQLELSSGNVEEIMAVCVIERGEILEECIWGRLGANNILIPVTSDVYKAATTNTERMGKSVSVREAKPGMHLVFKNGDEGMYLGKMVAIGYDPYEKDSHQKAKSYDIKALMPKPVHTYLKWDGEDRSGSAIIARDSLSLAEVREYKDLTQDEACALANQKIQEWDNDRYRYRAVDLAQKYGGWHTKVLQFTPDGKFDNMDWKTKLVRIGGDQSEVLANWQTRWPGRDSYHNSVIVTNTDEPGVYACASGSWNKAQPGNPIVNLSKHYCVEQVRHHLIDPVNGICVSERKQVPWKDWLGRTEMREETSYKHWEHAAPEKLEFFELQGTYNAYDGTKMTRALTER